MITRLITLLLIMFLAAGYAPMSQGQTIYGLDIFNTGPFDCSPGKKVHESTWRNNIGDLRIYQALVWLGASGGTVADIGTIVYRGSDQTIFFHQNWDHYAEPAGIHTDRLDLTPNYIRLEKDDRINMAYWCQMFNGKKEHQAHVIVTIWYGR